MSKTNPNESMHPTEQRTSQYADVPSVMLEGGLTKREYFAAMAMQGLLAGVYANENMLKEFKRQTGNDYISENARSYADALIEELNKEKV